MGSRSKRNQPVFQDEAMEVDTEDFAYEHQLMLQYLMHAKMVKKDDLVKIHRCLFKEEHKFKEVLATITSKINPLKMDIKEVLCDLTGEAYFVTIHTTGEPFFPRCCALSKSQSEFLKQILNGIVLSTDGTVWKMQAVNSCNTLSKSEAGVTIECFVKEKILIEMADGKLCLSPLAVVEFEPFFRTCSQDNLLVCDLCKQLVFVGKTCDNCDQRFHLHCEEKWYNSKRSECPSCSHKWK